MGSPDREPPPAAGPDIADATPALSQRFWRATPADGALLETQTPLQRSWWPLLLVFSALLAALAWLLYGELESSTRQARVLSQFASSIAYEVAPGATRQPMMVDKGPFDERMGYAHLPQFMARLSRSGFEVTRQTRLSPRAQSLVENGFNHIYQEKSQAGLTVLDRSGGVLHAPRFPGQVYSGFDALPRVLVNSLLFVEDRELLDERYPARNPVIDWERLAKASGVRLLKLVGQDDRSIGASTLATQLEKFRHSPDGRTDSVREKWRQMASASLRVYAKGEHTLGQRRQLVVDYFNALPLAARGGFGEVNGLGDGLHAWYGNDWTVANEALLKADSDPVAAAPYYKRALSLILSARRPSFYLQGDPSRLNEFTNSYLRVMGAAGVISPALRDAALAEELQFGRPMKQPTIEFATRKGLNLVRNTLLSELGVDSLYALDRLDLTVSSTLDADAQREASSFLRGLNDPERTKALGLEATRLLAKGDVTKVLYSFTLYERTERGNLLRVNTDSLDQPFDINTGAKLDLGSTSKVRTLITWLQLIAEVQARFAGLGDDALMAALANEQPHIKDRLTAWAISDMRARRNSDLLPLLESAMLRKYSAGTGQVFFTGGGQHVFANFEKADNKRIMTVAEALQRSVNLVFIRMMREAVDHIQYRDRLGAAALMETPDGASRLEYLRRFADREGQVFLRKFYRKFHGQTDTEMLGSLFDGVRTRGSALASAMQSVAPEAGTEVLAELLKTYVPDKDYELDEVERLFATHSRLSLADRAYVARVHPLELWLINYLRKKPNATMQEVIADGYQARIDSYEWLFKTRHRRAQERRIQDLLELDAFVVVHEMWRRLGYPFESMTPSLASAIGSSGDRPAALSELMGIIVGQGQRLPSRLIEHVRFAADTPYETEMRSRTPKQDARLAPEIAQVVHAGLHDVVAKGTARILSTKLAAAGLGHHVLGGKTGTGDHRFETFARGGRVLESRAVNRVAVFMFYIDDRFFGTITAFVPGEEADKFEFTSGLPVRLLGELLPRIAPAIGLTVQTSPPAATAVPAA